MPGVRDLPARPSTGTPQRTAKHARTDYECSLEGGDGLCLRTSENQGCETADVSVRRPCPGERCGRGIRELGSPTFLRRPRVAWTIGKCSANGAPSRANDSELAG